MNREMGTEYPVAGEQRRGRPVKSMVWVKEG
jgi:hypothetical protein